MKKQIALAVAVLVVILAGFYILGNKKGVATDTSKPIKIGLILPLTGSVAYIGEAAKNGAELAMDKINNDTSLKHKYQLVIEDDSLDAKKTASAINKLISIDKVNTVISVSSGSGNIVTPIAEQNKLPHIGMASDANVAKGDYNYIHWTQPNEEVEKLVAELQKRNIKKVAMLEVNQQGFLATSLILREKIKGTGITIVSDEIFNTGETNFKTIILRSQKTNPDIYLLGAFSPEIEILGKQMKDLNSLNLQC